MIDQIKYYPATMKNAPSFCSFIKKLYLCVSVVISLVQNNKELWNMNGCHLVTQIPYKPNNRLILRQLQFLRFFWKKGYCIQRQGQIFCIIFISSHPKAIILNIRISRNLPHIATANQHSLNLLSNISMEYWMQPGFLHLIPPQRALFSLFLGILKKERFVAESVLRDWTQVNMDLILYYHGYLI